MKEGIHPNYQPTTIRCACGNVIETGSTKQNITVEICSKCHPFFTGKQKLVDTSGRVDKFNKKYSCEQQKAASRGARPSASTARKARGFTGKKAAACCSALASVRRSHVCRLRSVFSEAHVPGKTYLIDFSPSEAKNSKA